MTDKATSEKGTGNRTGGSAVVEALERHGARHVFGVPGESFLSFLDAVRGSGLRFVNFRQEGGAAMCAEATGKITGKAGVAYVTRAPGATNASSGAFVAWQDATPMVLFVGQVDAGFRGRRAFQELDYRSVFGSFAKGVFEPGHPDEIPAAVTQALDLAEGGRPGPVVVAIPEDVLDARTDVPLPPPAPEGEPAPSAEDARRAAEMIAAAKSPMLIAGGSRWTREAGESLQSCARRIGAPVAVTFRRMGTVSAEHPCYVGDLGIGPNPDLVRLIRESDLLVVIGDELSEIPSQGYSLLGVPDPGVPLLHVMPCASELGRVYRPDLGIVASPGAFLESVARHLEPSDAGLDSPRLRAARESYERWREPPPAGEGSIYDECARWLGDNLPADAVVTTGAGNYCAWPNRHHPFARHGSLLGPISGSMGYGLPAAIAQKLAQPDRPVVCLAGDGCLQMTVQEIGTAVQEGLSFPLVVFDNGQYGTIRMHQHRRCGGRESAVRIENPDFAALAGVWGCGSCRVSDAAGFGAAMERALAAEGRPFLVHVECDPEALAPGFRAGSR